jgi:aminoacrylate hydrolase
MPIHALPTGVSLSYELHGGENERPPVVFIRGTGASGDRWLPQVRAYVDTYRCLIFDNRGSGASESPEGPYTVGQMADDAVALLDALGIGRAHLSGLSLGGAIAQDITIRFPERVATLQLHGTWGRTHGYARMYLGFLKRMLEEGGTDMYYEGALLYLFPPDHITEHYDDVMAVLDRMKAHASSPVGLLGQMHANLTHDLASRLHEIAAPTLITVGELDMCIPPFFSRELHAAIPGSELVVFPGGSHLFGLQDPETFNKVTLEWLNRQAEQ